MTVGSVTLLGGSVARYDRRRGLSKQKETNAKKYPDGGNGDDPDRGEVKEDADRYSLGSAAR